MVDIHCHILYGLDDGADTLETSVQMAEMAIADGVTHVVGTPHANSHYTFDPELIQQRREELQAAVGARLKLATGCDFHLSFENLQDLEKNPKKYTINQKNYLLVEFADFSIPPSMDDTMHRLHLMGLSPIITHPERNAMLRTKPERMYRWLHQGSYVQITAQSLLGRFGTAARERAANPSGASELWLDGSDATQTIADPTSLLQAIRDATARGAKVRAAYVPDAELGTRWFADKAVWVRGGQKYLPFGTVAGARRYIAAHPGSVVVNYQQALGGSV